MGRDTGGSVGGGASVTAAPAKTVRVAVIPGTGVGMVIRVAVGLGVGWAAVLVTCTTAVLEDDADWTRSASLLDMKPVMATYSPSIMTNRTIKKPKAYPLFMRPTMPLIALNSI